jgi:hypothetical protein
MVQLRTAAWDAFGSRDGVRTAVNTTKDAVKRDVGH